jgi:hypothetical protein
VKQRQTNPIYQTFILFVHICRFLQDSSYFCKKSETYKKIKQLYEEIRFRCTYSWYIFSCFFSKSCRRFSETKAEGVQNNGVALWQGHGWYYEQKKRSVWERTGKPRQ